KKGGLHRPFLKLLPAGRGWLMAEFGADKKKDVEDLAREVMEKLGRRRMLHRCTCSLIKRTGSTFGRCESRDWAPRRLFRVNPIPGRAGKTPPLLRKGWVVICASCATSTTNMNTIPHFMDTSAKGVSIAVWILT